MAEILYAVVEGPKGRAEIYEVNQEPGWLLHSGLPSRARTWDVVYEVRFGGQRHQFGQEGEAATVAWELVGMPYGGDTGPQPAGPRGRFTIAP